MEINSSDFESSKTEINQMYNQISKYIQQQSELQFKLLAPYSNTAKSALGFDTLGFDALIFNEGMVDYLESFLKPQQNALQSFFHLQQENADTAPSFEDLKDLSDLLQFNLELAGKALQSTLASMTDFHMRKLSEALTATLNTVLNESDGEEDLFTYAQRQRKLLESVVREYPQAIRDIKTEYGFHFERKGYKKVAETERFLLYQILPSDEKVSVKTSGKPVLLIPPYVLGENILCFLPGERKSFAHAYANQGVPTYVRVVKDIATTPAVQDMNGENDVEDTKYFCAEIKKIHGRPLTLNGYCQGGFFATLALLSGKLDGLVDSLITCVSPLDGTRSKALVEFMKNIPKNFTRLDYAISYLPDGKPVVDGKIMSWVYKLKSIETEAPLVTFYRDLAMFEKLMENDKEAGKTALAINHWLLYDQADMPVEITKLSFDSYTIPVDKEGTLPVQLFGRRLNFKRLEEKNIDVLICIADSDDLVDREAALAACDYIDAEVTIFPKGHAAIATSWSHPESKCALHTTFGDNYRGPVRFHLDLEAKQDQAKAPATTASLPENKLKTVQKPAQVEKPAPKKTATAAKVKISQVSKRKASTTPVSAAKKVSRKTGSVKTKSTSTGKTSNLSTTKTPPKANDNPTKSVKKTTDK